MKTHAFQKKFGNFLVKYGKSLDENVKAEFTITFSFEIIIFGVGMGIFYLIFQGIMIIVLGFILVIGLYLLYGAITEFIKALLLTIGNHFIKLSEKARFSCLPIKKDGLNLKEFFVEIKNREWFANAENVSCTIYMTPFNDLEDKKITDFFNNASELINAPQAIKGRWIDNSEEIVTIGNGKSKLIRFSGYDIRERVLSVFTTGEKDGKFTIPVRKYHANFYVHGNIKNGTFDFTSRGILTYIDGFDMKFEILDTKFEGEIKEFVSKNESLWA